MNKATVFFYLKDMCFWLVTIQKKRRRLQLHSNVILILHKQAKSYQYIHIGCTVILYIVIHLLWSITVLRLKDIHISIQKNVQHKCHYSKCLFLLIKINSHNQIINQKITLNKIKYSNHMKNKKYIPYHKLLYVG